MWRLLQRLVKSLLWNRYRPVGHSRYTSFRCLDRYNGCHGVALVALLGSAAAVCCLLATFSVESRRHTIPVKYQLYGRQTVDKNSATVNLIQLASEAYDSTERQTPPVWSSSDQMSHIREHRLTTATTVSKSGHHLTVKSRSDSIGFGRQTDEAMADRYGHYFSRLSSTSSWPKSSSAFARLKNVDPGIRRKMKFRRQWSAGVDDDVPVLEASEPKHGRIGLVLPILRQSRGDYIRERANKSNACCGDSVGRTSVTTTADGGVRRATNDNMSPAAVSPIVRSIDENDGSFNRQADVGLGKNGWMNDATKHAAGADLGTESSSSARSLQTTAQRVARATIATSLDRAPRDIDAEYVDSQKMDDRIILREGSHKRKAAKVLADDNIGGLSDTKPPDVSVTEPQIGIITRTAGTSTASKELTESSHHIQFLPQQFPTKGCKSDVHDESYVASLKRVAKAELIATDDTRTLRPRPKGGKDSDGNRTITKAVNDLYRDRHVYGVNCSSTDCNVSKVASISLPSAVLPNTVKSTDEIPAIIHQTWDDVLIPNEVSIWLRSWSKNNPGYDRWFWTDSGARRLLRQIDSIVESSASDANESDQLTVAPVHLPAFVSELYDSYPHPIHRADVRKYLALFTVGGIVADLDTECLRPLGRQLISDIVMSQSNLDTNATARTPTCLLASEPLLHGAFIYNYTEPIATAMFAICRPRHPFFHYVLSELLPVYAENARLLAWNKNVLNSTGPMFLTDAVRKYRNEKQPLKPEDDIFVASSDWFAPTVDPIKVDHFLFMCKLKSTRIDTPVSSVDTKAACSRLRKRPRTTNSDLVRLGSDLQLRPYTTHHWLHTWSDQFITRGGVIDVRTLRDITKIIL